MATITADHIASVSLKDAESEPQAFADKLGHSFEEYGFAVIADHGIPDALIHDAEEKAKAFFALPDEVKRKYLIEGGTVPGSASIRKSERKCRKYGIE
jgi:isopenicillin N synthase-like dioxygenase